MVEARAEALASAEGARQIFDPARGVFVDAAVIDRFKMASGAGAKGPAAIVEDETTIIVPASRDAIRQPDGCIDVVRKG